MSHTPGPWIEKKYPKVFGIMSQGGRQIAIMTEHYGDCPQVPLHQFDRSPQDASDAALITAAPELLEIAKAYRNLLKTMAHSDGEVDTFQHIENIIAKAEGRSRSNT